MSLQVRKKRHIVLLVLRIKVHEYMLSGLTHPLGAYVINGRPLLYIYLAHTIVVIVALVLKPGENDITMFPIFRVFNS